MVTLKDVGELAGVTATTASAALRGKDYVKPETTQRVCDAARKLGYKINLSGRSLRSGRSDTITFLTSGLEGDYFSHLAMCVAEEVHKRDSHMLIELSRYLTDDNDLSYTFSDGIIAINAPRAVDILKRHPAVMLENYDTSLPIDTVNAPSDAGSRAAIEHLIARGCARIGIVGEMFTAIDERSNLGLDHKLVAMGVEVHRMLNFTNRYLRYNEPNLRVGAKDYLTYDMGPTSTLTIAAACRYAREGFDGIIHAKSSGCTPEIDCVPVLQRVSEDHRLPMLYLTYDTQTSDTGLDTRLEAFYDMLAMKKEKKR